MAFVSSLSGGLDCATYSHWIMNTARPIHIAPLRQRFRYGLEREKRVLTLIAADYWAPSAGIPVERLTSRRY